MGLLPREALASMIAVPQQRQVLVVAGVIS